METIWKLIEICLITIITYACELWDPNKEGHGMINRILDNIIKRILMVPTSTPREKIVYMETGIRDMSHSMTHRGINMLCSLETTKSNDNIHTRNRKPQNMEKSTIKIMQDMGINPDRTTKIKHNNKKK